MDIFHTRWGWDRWSPTPPPLKNANFLNLHCNFTEIMPRKPPPRKTVLFPKKFSACMHFHHDCIHFLIESYKDDI